MQIIHLRTGEVYDGFSACGLVLGNFDGVHRGHQALIAELKRLNAKRSPRLPLAAFCFTKHPSAVLGSPVPQLIDNQKKMKLLREQGLQFIVLCDFAELRDLSPEDFVKDVLIGKLHCKIAVCGFNYTFGKGGAGRAEDLRAWLGTQPQCEVAVVPPVTDGQITVSSSAIRCMLERGHPEDATRLLGRPYTLCAVVKSGKQVGREMETPTANLFFPEGSVIPAHGVYAVMARVGRRTYKGICNVGTRPTFDDGEDVTCESFLFDFNGDLYKKELEISFLRFLRAERAFADRAALQAQIEKDVQRAKDYFKNEL